MSTPGQYGGLKYESPTARALGTINDDEYQKVYNDQAKLTSKLVSDVSFLASNLRKTQQQVDQANENVIQQLQDFLADIQVIMGGQGDTGFDFGDFKYVLEAYGALFDFIGPDGNIQTPVNLDAAVQNFFRQYLYGGSTWQQQFDNQVDSEIATMLDIMGEIPILNQAAQQLAIIIDKNRNDIDTINSVFSTFFQAFNIPPGGTFNLATFMNATNALYTGLETLFSDVNFGSFQPVFEQMARWDQEVIDAIYKLSIGDWSGLNVLIPISQLTNIEPNLQLESDFAHSDSIAPNTSGWSWDFSVGRTELGSAKGICDGTSRGINGRKIAILEGQSLNPSVWIKWANSTSSGNVVKLFVRADNGVDYLIQDTALATTSGGWTQLSGSWLNPTFSGITSARIRFVITEGATSGNVWFDDVVISISGALIPQDWINNLEADLGANATQIQTLEDDVNARTDAYATFVASFNTAIADSSLTELNDAWITYTTTVTTINSTDMATWSQILDSFFHISDSWNWFLGLFSLTPTDITSSINGASTWNDIVNDWIQPTNTFTTQAFTDTNQTQLGAALSGDVVNSGDWAWLAQFMNSYYDLTGQAHITSVDNANTLATRNNQPVINGPDNTTESNINFNDASDQFSLRAPNSIIAFVRCKNVDVKNGAEFTGLRPSTVPSGLNVNVYKVDFVNSLLTYITTTSFSSAQLNFTAETWFFASLGSANVQPGDVIAIEYQSLDATNYFNLFSDNSIATKPAHPIAMLPALAATRNAGTTTPSGTIPFSDLTWTNANLTYSGLTISSPPPPIYPPYSKSYTVSSSLVLEAWVNFVDLIGVGMGGGGQGETGGTVGRGGSPGAWNEITLQVGVDIPAGATITITVTAQASSSGTTDPGSGGAFFGDGKDGASTTFTWHNMSSVLQTLTCAGGLGGGLHNSSNLTTYGQGPGNETYNGETYVGGAAQLFPAVGNPPGGSGPGGQPFQFGFNGARGQAWTVERQT